MKRLLSLVVAGFSLIVAATAQVTVELQVDQKQFLQGESLVPRIRVGNNSGETLTFGASKDWLTFEVRSLDGFVIQTRRDPEVLGEFNLPSSSIATKKVNLASAFDLSQPGRYRITATVYVPQWDKRWSSREISVDVIKGTKIWEREFGVPTLSGGVPEMRKFALVEARYLDDMMLYVRLSDVAEANVMSAKPIGKLLNFSRPAGQMDRHNRLHILWQDGARTYTYATFAYGGELTLRQTYQVTDSRPVLRPGPDGAIQVVGGNRLASTRDIPPTSGDTRTPPSAP